MKRYMRKVALSLWFAINVDAAQLGSRATKVKRRAIRSEEHRRRLRRVVG